MEKMISRKVADVFAERCEDVAHDVLSLWGRYSCYYIGDEWRPNRFQMEGSHSWGTAYCVWYGSDKALLFERLREAGATKIRVHQFRWNRFCISFDMKVKTRKELEQEGGCEG